MRFFHSNDKVCPGCGAPVDPKASECRYCRRPMYGKRVKNVIMLIGGGIVGGIALSLAIHNKFSFTFTANENAVKDD